MKRAALATAALACGACGAPPPAEVALSMTPPAQWSAAAAPGQAGERIGEQWWLGFGDERLAACVAQALANNRDLMAATARMAAAIEQANIAGATLLPVLDAAFDATRARRVFVGFPFSGSVPSVTSTTYGLSLNLTWEVDLWGRLRSAEAAALAEAQAAGADLAGVELSLIGQTMKAYFATVEARQQLALAEATVASVRATTEDVRDRFRRGVRPALDAWQAETQLAQAEANVSLRRQVLQAAVRQLEILLGDYPRGMHEGAGVLAATLPEVPAGLPSELLGRRPDLAAAERRLAAAGCRVDAARAALYPRIALTASGGTTSADLEDIVDGDFSVWSLGANLLQPLFRGGELRAEVRRNEALAAEAVASYASAVLVAFAEVEISLADAALLVDQERAAIAAAQSAAAARDLARERYQLGLTDFLAVTDGQRQAFTTESARIALLRQRLDNRIDLFLALGGGFAANPPAVQTTP
jgi:NodT family efflux transporter outer membrane factor (OMF) lipoprotein